MKATALLVLLICSSMFAQKQVDKFSLSSNGFENYIVYEYNKKTTSEIYSQVKKYFQYNVRDAEISNYSEIKNEYLTYSVHFPEAIKVKDVIKVMVHDITLDIEVRFKESKIRLDVDINNMNLRGNGVSYTLQGGVNSIFKKNGAVRKRKIYKETIVQMNELANSIADAINTAVKGKTDYKKDW